MKKAISILLCAVLLLSMLAACGGNSSPTATNGNDGSSGSEGSSGNEAAAGLSGEITYWNAASGPEERALDSEMFARFNELYPNVKINYETMDGEAYKTRITTVAASNNLPDIFEYWVGEQFNTLVSSGNVRDLTPMYNADSAFKDSFVGGALDSVTIDGKIYGAPTAITCMAVWYNKKIFADNGVSVPTTFDEMQEVADTLAAKGINPIAVGSMDRWPLLGWFAYLAQRIGGSELYYDVTAGDKRFNEPAFVQAGQLYKKLSKTGFMNGHLATDADMADALFAAGDAAMVVMGAWSIGTYTSNPDTAEDMSFFPFPDVTGGVPNQKGYLYGGIANTFALSNSTSNPEAAEAFLKFIMSEHERTLRVELTGNLATVKVSPKKERMNPLAYQFVEYVSDELQGFFPYTDQALKPDEAERLLDALVAIIADPTRDVEAELAKIK